MSSLTGRNLFPLLSGDKNDFHLIIVFRFCFLTFCICLCEFEVAKLFA